VSPDWGFFQRLLEVGEMATEAPQDVSRRGFLAWIAGLLLSAGVLFSAIPFLGTLLAKPSAGTKEDYLGIGPVGALKAGEPVSLTFTEVQQEAYVRQTVVRNVWAVKETSGDVVVFSPVCPHLGCQYTWDAASRHFVCPCHASVWQIDGKRIGGPTPRNLDTLPSKVENGTLMVKWEQYKLATPEKTPIA
jgi:Rieske Fe-S protein